MKLLLGNSWVTGDFNGDGATDGSDFGLWNANKFTSFSDGQTMAVPEPRIAALGLCLAWFYVRCRSPR
ncbi:MAG TPA: hypothetical protein VIY86_14100 [Pirellulaceae bacterium]